MWLLFLSLRARCCEAHFIYMFIIVVHDVTGPISGWQDGKSSQLRCCGAVYLNLCAGDFTNTLSHIYGSWYLPIFLFRDGSLILIRIASLIDVSNALVLSAHSTEIVNGYVMTSGGAMVMSGWRDLHVFSEPFCKCSAWLPYVFFLAVHPATLISVNHPTFLEDGVSVLGVY